MNIKHAENVTVVKPMTRRLDSTTTSTYHEKLQQLIENGINHILIDLSNILYLDTRGIAFLIDAMQQIEDRGEIALCSAQERVETFLHSAKLDRIFRIFPDQTVALSRFSM